MMIEVELENGNLEVTGTCGVTQKPYSVQVPKENIQGYIKWRNREMKIQDALPNMSRDDREFLISGTSPEGWKIMFVETADC